MANPEVLRPKSAEQLAQQVSNVSHILGESITQPSFHNESLRLSLEELKQHFPERYRIYFDTLWRESAGVSPHPLAGQKLRILNSLDSYVSAHMNGDAASRTLRDRQMTVFEDLRGFLESGGSEGYIKLPTAAGKTVLFTEFVEATGLRTLIVVPTKILVDQTEQRFQQFAPNVEVGKVYSDAKEFDRQVTITTYDSFIDKVEFGNFIPDNYDLLILDEAHKSLSPRRQGIVGIFNRAIKLGFTATPKYAVNKEVKDLLSNEIHSMDIPEAVELGLLSPFSVYLAQSDIDLSNIRITADGEYDERDLERAINITSRNLAAVDVYQQLFPGQKTIMYCVGVRHAEALAKHLNDHGIAADFISGYQSRAEQQERLEKFRNGEINVICNANILIEGFDESTVVACFNLRPTLSAVVAEQRGGRVLRLDPNNPNKHAIIVDFVGRSDTAGGGAGNNPPITFAQIIERAEILNKMKLVEEERGTDSHTKLYPSIEISGINVITSAEEVMRIIREVNGITEEGWCSVDALSRRFRLPEEFIAKFLKPLRASHLEYFEMRPQGDKLKEYVSPEAINILRNYFAPAERIKKVQENELPVSESSLIVLFRGKYERVKEIAESVLEELAKQDFALIKVRVAANNPIIVVDKQRFIELMQQRGVQLKDQTLEEVKDTDYPITNEFLRWYFAGSSDKVYSFARKAIEQLRESNPTIVAQRKTKVGVITVVLDKDVFINSMATLGIRIKEQPKESAKYEEVKSTDFSITTGSLRSVFKGGGAKLKPIANQVLEKLRTEDNGLIQNRKSGHMVVVVVTGRERFIQEMVNLGAKLSEQTEQLQPNDFVLSAKHLYTIFRGEYKILSKIAREVMDYYKNSRPELIVRRKNKSGYSTVFIDGNLFVQEMISRGARLKQSDNKPS